MQNNGFYKITEKLLNTAENIGVVNTVLFARTEEKDLYKNNLYPLIHINPQNSPLTLSNGAITFNFEVGVFNQRLEDKNGTNKRDGDFNIIDNFATCSAIINEFISSITLNIGDDFVVDNIGDAQPLYYDDTNGLDGWVFNITISISNTINFC